MLTPNPISAICFILTKHWFQVGVEDDRERAMLWTDASHFGGTAATQGYRLSFNASAEYAKW